jgi:phosphohistidine phosphatase
MALFLVQHGKSLSKDVDPEQGLSEEGIAGLKRIAEVARGYRIPVAAILHSGKKRARQTAEIFEAALHPPGGVQEKSGLKPLDDVSDFAQTISADDNLMLVGHLPFMERLTAYLITGAFEKPVFKFQNGGIVCLTVDPDTQGWVIKWSLMPDIG